MNRQRGITLVELLVALVIVAILAAVAVPQYNRFQFRGYRTDVFSMLGECAMAAERRHSDTFSYASIVDAGTHPDPAICPDQAPRDAPAGSERYTISVPVADATSFTLRATPTNAQDGDGIIEFDSTNAKRWDKDDSGGFTAGEDNWTED